jgi:hypothetical protein
MGAHDKFLCIHKKWKSQIFVVSSFSLVTWEGVDRMAVGISIGVILGFDVLALPVGCSVRHYMRFLRGLTVK